MATQSNLDYQTFWAPRPLSRPLCVEAQSQSHTLKPQPKSAPLPQNDKRVMIDLPKRSPYLSPRPASGRDDVIYISDDAASDINDASHEPFGETLPSIQAIMQSLEDAGEISNIDNRFKQPPQRKDAHEASSRSVNFTPLKQELLNESQRLTVAVAAKCPLSVSASTSQIYTSATTLIANKS